MFMLWLHFIEQFLSQLTSSSQVALIKESTGLPFNTQLGSLSPTVSPLHELLEQNSAKSLPTLCKDCLPAITPSRQQKQCAVHISAKSLCGSGPFNYYAPQTPVNPTHHPLLKTHLPYQILAWLCKHEFREERNHPQHSIVPNYRDSRYVRDLVQHTNQFLQSHYFCSFLTYINYQPSHKKETIET